MIESTHGLIFRTHRFADASLIVHWLTRAEGRLGTLAKGALRPKSPLRGKLDLFYEADFSFSRSRRSDLHVLREVSVRGTHAALRCDLGWLRQACYGAALIEQATERETPLPAVYQLSRQFLEMLPQGPARPGTVFAFELKLLDELGLRPDLAALKLTAGAREIAAALLAGGWDSAAHLRLSKAQVSELGSRLQEFIVFHLNRVPRGRSAAIGVE